MSDRRDSPGSVGRATRRSRTAAFTRGDGHYIADVIPSHTCVVRFVRSSEPHALIRGIDLHSARQVTGVVAIFTGHHVAHLKPAPNLWQLPGQQESLLRPLAIERVRYVGEPVVAVVAETDAAAVAACEAVTVAYEALPLVGTLDAALARDAPKLYEHWASNVVATSSWKVGDAESAFSRAHVIVSEIYYSGRVHPLPVEPRGVFAVFDARDDTLTVHVPTQSPHQVREGIAVCLDIPEHRVRVIAPDIGGSFGQKACLFPEEVMVAFAARATRRPVHWLEQRAEAFVASVHGRDQRVSITAGFSDTGRLLAVRGAVVMDKGADSYRTSIGPAWITGALLTGPYIVQAVDIEACAVVTNKTPTGAYRGFGQPEANFAIERTLDIAAKRLGIDPLEIRRLNLPSSLPSRTLTGIGLDSGRYLELLDMVSERANWHRAKPSGPDATLRRGRGMAFYIEVTNFGPSVITNAIGIAAGGFDIAVVRMEPSGHIKLYTGQTPMGQGVETALAQICADELAVNMADVAVVHGDTLACSYTAYASGGSRGAGVGGSAVALACRQLAEKLRALGAHHLRTEPANVELRDGGVRALADERQRIGFADLARVAYRGAGLPTGMTPGLEAQAVFDPLDLAISYGAVIVDLEIDTTTGFVKLERIVFGHDCGPQINPALVAGQVVGGIVQGIGCALFEEMGFSSTGRPLVTSMLDYPMPLAADVPPIELLHLETPSPHSVTGVKGVGESGVIAIPAAIANALADAIGEDPRLNQLPLLPEKLWSVCNVAAGGTTR